MLIRNQPRTAKRARRLVGPPLVVAGASECSPATSCPFTVRRDVQARDSSRKAIALPSNGPRQATLDLFEDVGNISVDGKLLECRLFVGHVLTA